MLYAPPLGRALPLAPVIDGPAAERAAEHDLGCASTYPTPRPASAVNQLAKRILTGTMLAKFCTMWGAVAFGLWMVGTAVALVLIKLMPAWGSTPILVLGFGGLGGGLASGLLWIRNRRCEAQAIARDGQLVMGIATYQSHETLTGELAEMFSMPLGETHYCITFSLGFIKHEVWVILPAPPNEGERHNVLVEPGARFALVFDALGRAHVGELHRI